MATTVASKEWPSTNSQSTNSLSGTDAVETTDRSRGRDRSSSSSVGGKRRRFTARREKSTLVPLRVDVTCSRESHGHQHHHNHHNNVIRIVDTILFDSTCWPVPLHPARLDESIEANVQELAYSIVGDAEVTGMGRTIRHFTNRVEVWSMELQQRVADQLRPQLRALIPEPYQYRHHHHGKDDDGGGGGGGDDDDDDQKDASEKKRTKKDSGDPTNLTGTENNTSISGIGAAAATATAATTATATASNGGDRDRDRSTAQTPRKNQKSSRVKITLRLNVSGILIEDDLEWDSSVPGVCPILFAKRMAHDLNLPPEGAVAIATAIVEQSRGDVRMQPTPPGARAASARPIEARDQAANMIHLVAQHRPASLDKKVT